MVVPADEAVIVQAEATRISEVDMVARVQRRKDLRVIRSTSSLVNADAIVYFDTARESRSALIDSVDRRDDIVDIALSFKTVVPVGDLAGRTALSSANARITIESEGSAYFLDVLRALNAVFAALDSSRVVCDEVLAQIATASDYSLPQPRIRHLSKSNPLIIEFTGAAPAVALLLTIAGATSTTWLSYHKGKLISSKASKEDQEAEILRQAARKLELENERTAKSMELTTAIEDAAIRIVRDGVPGQISETDDELRTPRLRSLIDLQLRGAIERLFDEGRIDFDSPIHDEISELVLPGGSKTNEI